MSRFAFLMPPDRPEQPGPGGRAQPTEITPA